MHRKRDAKKRTAPCQSWPGPGPPGGGGGFGGFGGFGDIFESFFGGGSAARRNGPLRGSDIEVTLRITFEEAAFGVKKEVSINRREACEHCHGTGAKPGSGVKTCPTCNGTGQIRQEQRTMFGSFANIATCPTCHWQGKIIEEPCEACRGSGRVQQSRKISVNIPAGIDNGQILTLSGQGEAGERGGPAGDLLVYIQVRPHKVFTREGANLFMEMPISFGQAALEAVLFEESAFASLCAARDERELPYSVLRAGARDLAALGELTRLEPADLLALAAHGGADQSAFEFLPAWELETPRPDADPRLHGLELSAQGVSALAAFFRRHGTGLFARYPGCTWVGVSERYPLGLRGIEYATMIPVFASPTGISSYTMAAQMGSDGELAGNCVVFSSALSSLTLFFWIFLFKTLGMF